MQVFKVHQPITETPITSKFSDFVASWFRNAFRINSIQFLEKNFLTIKENVTSFQMCKKRATFGGEIMVLQSVT